MLKIICISKAFKIDFRVAGSKEAKFGLQTENQTGIRAGVGGVILVLPWY